MDISSYVTVLPIVIICYLVGIGCKASKKISDKTIPVIVGIVAKKPILTEYAPIMHEREKTKIYVLLCKK